MKQDKQSSLMFAIANVKKKISANQSKGVYRNHPDLEAEEKEELQSLNEQLRDNQAKIVCNN